MRAIFLIVATAAVLAQARPDLTIGYNPNAPKDNYDGPLPDHDAFGVRSAVNLVSALEGAQATGGYQTIGTESAYTQGPSIGLFGASGGAFQSISGGDFQSGASSSGHQSGASDVAYQSGGSALNTFGASSGAVGQSTTGSVGYSNGGSVQTNYVTSTGAGQGSIGTAGLSAFGPTQSLDSVSTTNTGSATSYQSSSSYGQQSTLPPIITKSFYFESAPDEPEENQGPRYVHVGRAQKNYKVIFIKAPSYGLNSQVIPIVPPNEEKTIIYVLSKKPEINQDIELPPVPTTEAIKPDVFFIKYKTDKEAHDAQHQIQTVYETNPNVEGDARFDAGHLQTIANAAEPNVISATGAIGSGASYTETTKTTLVSPSVATYVSGAAVSATDGASSATSEQSGYTVLSGTQSNHDEQVVELHGGAAGHAGASITISQEASALEPEYLPPGAH